MQCFLESQQPAPTLLTRPSPIISDSWTGRTWTSSWEPLGETRLVTAGRAAPGSQPLCPTHLYSTTTTPAPPRTLHPRSHAWLSATCLPLPLIWARLASCRQLSLTSRAAAPGGRRGSSARLLSLVSDGKRQELLRTASQLFCSHRPAPAPRAPGVPIISEVWTRCKTVLV